MLKKYCVLIFLSIISLTSFADNKDNNDKNINQKSIQTSNIAPKNYQQLKYSLLNLNQASPNRVPKRNYQSGDDYLMLYVAGGVVVATAATVLLNGTSEYEDGLGQTNTGIIIGGSMMAALIVTKYFVDKTRR
jgi:hypothetical protein